MYNDIEPPYKIADEATNTKHRRKEADASDENNRCEADEDCEVDNLCERDDPT